MMHTSQPPLCKLGKLGTVCRRSSAHGKTEIRCSTGRVTFGYPRKHAYFRDRVAGIVSGCDEGERRADGIQIRERK